MPNTWHRLGLAWGAIRQGWGRPQLRTKTPTLPIDDDRPPAMTTADKVDLAAGALGAIGLVNNFAPYIVLCGHAGTAENNAFASGYDCGACGGNGGQVNAQVLAQALNDPEVRRGLADRGIQIPDDTVAIAAAHNTTTEVIDLDPSLAEVPAGGTAMLRDRLAQAGGLVRAERRPLLPGAKDAQESESARRGADWSQPFPEWGLAGNAAFVIAPRELTKDLDLAGRAFLHSYVAELDPSYAVLETLLTAPAVVTQWINSQYYFSSVDPQTYGAGDKTTHNVVGDVGVMSGAHGDLRVGLPWQALSPIDLRLNREHGLHEPLRLQIVVRADPAAISEVLATHPALSNLFSNNWAALTAIDPATGELRKLRKSLEWVPWREGIAQEVPAN